MTTKTIKPHSRALEGKVNIREGEGENEGKKLFDFYASVFNQKSKLIRDWDGTYYEIMAPGCFDDVLRDANLNCLATVDHSRQKMLGRTKSKTLMLSTDATGLNAIVDIPDTQLGKDTAVQVGRGDYFECSFIYTADPADIKWDRTGEIPVRTVTKVQKLYDVSIVIDGAYANTVVAARSKELEYEIEDDQQPDNQRAEAQHDILNKEIEILKLKK
jgi:HK97 family phage prohead protease